MRRLFACLFCLVWLVCYTPGTMAAEPSKAERLFALKVQPIFRSKCLACHGEKPDEIEGGFDIRSRESVLKGGESFADKVLIPGKSADSILYSVVRRTDPDFAMPPKEAEKLTEEQTWFIRDWIDGGAPWPDEQRVAEIYRRFAKGVSVKTSGGLNREWTDRKYMPEDLWAWRPIGNYSTDVESASSGQHPIDVFIDRRLADAGIKPAPLCDRRTFIRRATFDLTGLPPTSKDVNDFVNDSREDDPAIADLIDRLLKSPHYGEQWGRHWLDVVRYADSSGFANDWERPNAWRYRDYVIRAFNEDRPYDQFVHEQLAGDEIDSKNPENLIAAGFLRMGPWEQTGMSVARVTRQAFLDDVTDSVGQVFLANALQCCRCHDHKFDPIPTQDYYSFQAIFATTQFAETDAAWLPTENRDGIKEDQKYHQMRRRANSELGQRLKKQTAENERNWFKDKGLPYKSRAEAKKAKAPKEHFPPARLRITPADYGQERIFRKWQTRFSWETDRYQPVAFSIYSGKTPSLRNVTNRLKKPDDVMAAGRLEQTAILTGGDLFAAAAKVEPAVLSAVPGAMEFQIPSDAVGRRTALADWITSKDNTLTSRVMVNRIWHYHFGRGIAANPNNFGTTGKKPTHPKLLDWLAREFMANKWSIKQMHRLIMTSRAYRRSTNHPDSKQLADHDPDNKLYAVFLPRRLEAEELRDTMLAVSGELNREAGGVPIRPDMNMEAALQPRMIMGTFAPSYVPNPTPDQRNRRSVYALKLRGHRDPMMETFNQPGSEKSCEIRDTSTVAPQALTLLNSDETADRALAFASRVLKNTKSDDAAIDRVFRDAFGRSPTDQEAADSLAHWQEMTSVEKQITYKPRVYPSEVVREAIDENTGKPFSFTERLFVYDDYVHDRQPHEVDARTRGLADLCLAILNSNEFVFVY